MHEPPLVITPGEPAGIGPDLVLRLAQQTLPHPVVVVASRELLQTRAQQLGISISLKDYHASAKVEAQRGMLYLKNVPMAVDSIPGKLNTANANYVLQTLRTATNACLNGEFSALVTGPVHKGIINQAGIPFTGHTEYLAELSHAPLPVMMLMTNGLRVALATTHLPLRQVADAISPDLIKRCLRILHHDLQTRFGISSPRINVCGLNPHAGEDGHLGREELDIINPVLDQLRDEGMQLRGPLPADTAFTQNKMLDCDAYLAMYHDQGLVVLKHIGFGKAVNVTLGLPFIRTSVDHGTALDLAGTGKIDDSSLHSAIDAALRMCRTH